MGDLKITDKFFWLVFIDSNFVVIILPWSWQLGRRLVESAVMGIWSLRGAIRLSRTNSKSRVAFYPREADLFGELKARSQCTMDLASARCIYPRATA